jgi:hypothetical protein
MHDGHLCQTLLITNFLPRSAELVDQSSTALQGVIRNCVLASLHIDSLVLPDEGRYVGDGRKDIHLCTRQDFRRRQLVQAYKISAGVFFQIALPPASQRNRAISF